MDDLMNIYYNLHRSSIFCFVFFVLGASEAVSKKNENDK